MRAGVDRDEEMREGVENMQGDEQEHEDEDEDEKNREETEIVDRPRTEQDVLDELPESERAGFAVMPHSLA